MVNNSIIRKAAIELYGLDSKDVVKVAGIARTIVNWIKGFGDPEFQKKLQELQAISPEIKELVDNLSVSIDKLNKSLSNTDPEGFGNALEEVKPLVSGLSSKLENLDEKASDVISEAPVEAVIDDNGNKIHMDSVKNLERGWYKDKDLYTQMKGLLPSGLDVPVERSINKPMSDFAWMQQFSPEQIRMSDNMKNWIIDAIANVMMNDSPTEVGEINTAVEYLNKNRSFVLNQLKENILNGTLRSYTFPSTGQPNKMVAVVDAGEITVPGINYTVQFPTVFLHDRFTTLVPVKELELFTFKNIRPVKSDGQPKQEFTGDMIRSLLEKNNWNVAYTAREIGMGERSLRRRMDSFNITRPQEEQVEEPVVPLEQPEQAPEGSFEQFMEEPQEEKIEASKAQLIEKHAAEFQRMTSQPSWELQNISQNILQQMKAKKYPIGSAFNFNHGGNEYQAKLEVHPAGPRNPVPHPGISLFYKETGTNNKLPQRVYTSVASIKGLENKSPQFISKLIQIGNRLNIDPSFLASVMRSESGFNHKAVNPMGGATGLIQFMPNTAKMLGTTTEDLANMSDVEQLDYVEKFFKPWSGRIKSPGDLYMATFLPIFVGKDSETIIGEKNNHKKISGNLTYHKVWEYNKVFDYDKDGKIRISDVTGRANKIYNSGMNIGKLTPESVNQSNKIEYGKQQVVDIQTQPQSPFGGDDAKALMNFLYASGPIEKIVKRAIYEKILPKTRVLISVGSRDEKFHNRVRYAKILASALRIELDAECSIHNYNNKIEIEVDVYGSEITVKKAVRGISEGVADAFSLSIGNKISSSFVIDGKSAYALIDSDTMESCFRKFAFDMGAK